MGAAIMGVPNMSGETKTGGPSRVPGQMDMSGLRPGFENLEPDEKNCLARGRQSKLGPETLGRPVGVSPTTAIGMVLS